MKGWWLRPYIISRLVAVGLLASCWFATAKTDVTFWNSVVNNRLNQIEVHQVAQDGSGALWFATQEGLTRYNGVTVDTFTAANAAEGGLQAGEIKALAVSPVGELWVLTQSIQVFRSATQKFEVIEDLAEELTPRSMSFNDDGVLWIGLDRAVGLYRPGLSELLIFDLPAESDADGFSAADRWATPVVQIIPHGSSVFAINSDAV